MTRRTLIRVSALLLLLAAGGPAWLHHMAREAEPGYSGERRLAGLTRPVTVDFDRHAVPHVRAPTPEALFFAQGYLEARERMWQMDLLRRAARGRLAEVLGEKALAADRLFRTLGLERAARRDLAVLTPPVRRHLDAYTRGVNAYLGTAGGRPPLEYRLAGFRPAAWEPLDSLAIGEFMAFSLSYDLRRELLWLRLARRLGPRLAAELFPSDEGLPAPADSPDLPAYPLTGLLDGYPALAARLGLPLPGAVSNAWAVAGSRTADGRPLLANDPHLAPSLPGIWYELELRAPGYHAAGVSLPGTPYVLLGHNPDLAWGFTTVMADTQDLFLERATPDGRAVLRNGGPPEPIRETREQIRVKGRAAPLEIRVRRTANGTLIDEILGPATRTPLDLPRAQGGWLPALRWNIELPDRALEGMYRLNTARTLAEGRAAARLFRHAAQNVLFAHRDGGIAWQVSGALPRRRGGSGAYPQPGWDGAHGWDGYLPAAENPGLENPADGLLVSANDRTLPPERAAAIGHFWMPPYRARRIRALLEAAPRLDLPAMAAIQRDRVSLEALRLTGRLRQLRDGILAANPALTAPLDALLAWDGGFRPDSAPAALCVRLREALYPALFGDELGADLVAFMHLSAESYNALQETLFSGRSSFWDDRRTPVRETPAVILARALEQAVAKLESDQGAWRDARLDRLRRLVFPHAFHDLPLLGRLFDAGPLGVGGDDQTVNMTKAFPETPETPYFLPSYRFLYTPGDWSRTRGGNTLGQSGHRFSPYRDDQLEAWRSGDGHVWHWGGVPEAERLGRLRLLPGGNGQSSDDTANYTTGCCGQS